VLFSVARGRAVNGKVFFSQTEMVLFHLNEMIARKTLWNEKNKETGRDRKRLKEIAKRREIEKNREREK